MLFLKLIDLSRNIRTLNKSWIGRHFVRRCTESKTRVGNNDKEGITPILGERTLRRVTKIIPRCVQRSETLLTRTEQNVSGWTGCITEGCSRCCSIRLHEEEKCVPSQVGERSWVPVWSQECGQYSEPSVGTSHLHLLHFTGRDERLGRKD